MSVMMTGGTTILLGSPSRLAEPIDSDSRVRVGTPKNSETLFQYLERVSGRRDDRLYKQILGAANPFKEGDEIIGVSAAGETSRLHARTLLANTTLAELDRNSVFNDQISDLNRKSISDSAAETTRDWTVGQLKANLLAGDESEIKRWMAGLSSHTIGCVVKLMSNAELIQVGSKIFNPLPGSQIGAKGYLGARLQPNSPTDNVDDIRWQVFAGWSFAVGDVLLGSNPVSSNPESVRAIEKTLQDVIATFGLEATLPHCVLSHIDVQAEVERREPETPTLWFQNTAGNANTHRTFDINVDKMVGYATSRAGRYDLYFETGQGADFTNGHCHGFDMVLHESRKYGFIRAISSIVTKKKPIRGERTLPWVHVNDVVGFIGPEVFRSREQLVRCCLEDIVMGKLHGLCIGLDVRSTLHMDISLDDLNWCLDQVMPACPAYLMAVPTKIDRVLGYLTTGFQDHVRLRAKFGRRVNDAMASFFQELGVVDEDGNPTEHFGDPIWVYLQYQRRKGDERSSDEIIREGESHIEAIQSRGLLLTQGHGENHHDLESQLKGHVQRGHADGKKSIWAELPSGYGARFEDAVMLETCSGSREKYLLHPESGEHLSDASERRIADLKQKHSGQHDVQIIISDGLNALSVMDFDQLDPFLERLRNELSRSGRRVAPESIVVRSGRVRVGYQIGESLFSGTRGSKSILHIIGERPGTGQRTFSIYITSVDAAVWSEPGAVDHNLTRVVSGVVNTALNPRLAANDVLQIVANIV